MEWVTRSLGQVVELFRSMSPGTRLTTALLLAVVVISVGYLVAWHGTAADTLLMNGASFAPEHLPAMEAAFARANLNTYEFVGTKIRVPRSQQNAYMAALAESNALPENYSKILDNVLAADTPWGDRQQREQRLKAAKQKQLEMVIRSMKGIQGAYVIYDASTRQGFSKETILTASVNVMPLAGQPMADAQVLAIRTLVARSIAGLAPENVAVTDLSNGRTLAGTGDSLSSPLEDPYGSRKQMYEQQWKDKVQAALSYVPGVSVSANVELDRERSRTKETVQHDPKAVAVQVSEKTRTSTSEGSGPGGRAGFPAQQPNAALALSSPSGKSSREDNEESETQTTNVVSGSRETVEDVGLTPRRVTISIGLPNSYFRKVWLERNPPAAGQPPATPDAAALELIRTEETTKIKGHVAKLLPTVDGVTDPSELVQVTSFQDITAPELPPLGFGDNALGWFVEHWNSVGMVALAAVGLLMLRSLVRAVPAAATTTAPAAAAATSSARTVVEEEEEREAVPAGPRLRRFAGGSGPTLRDELTQLVQEDPDAAANILRSWIGAGAGKT